MSFGREGFGEMRARDAVGAVEAADFREIRDRLTRSVHRVCPAWLRSSADDIVQNALLRVLEITKTRESTDSVPASYLWKVAYTATVDEIRRHRRRPEVAWDAEAQGRTEPADAAGPEAERSFRELGLATEACLKGLPEGRRVVVGFHLLGYAAGEIAASFGWGEKRVRNLLHRGLVALRHCLEAKGIRH